MNVFSAVKDAPPMIARQEDCQTCFMCELYCPTDALYVAPDVDRVTHAKAHEVEAGGFSAVSGQPDGRWPMEPTAQWINPSS